MQMRNKLSKSIKKKLETQRCDNLKFLLPCPRRFFIFKKRLGRVK